MGGAAKLLGESRPGWKVLRVLANLLIRTGVDYDSSDEIRDALNSLCGEAFEAERSALGGRHTQWAEPTGPWMDIPPYQAMCWCAAPKRSAKPRTGA